MGTRLSRTFRRGNQRGSGEMERTETSSDNEGQQTDRNALNDQQDQESDDEMPSLGWILALLQQSGSVQLQLVNRGGRFSQSADLSSDSDSDDPQYYSSTSGDTSNKRRRVVPQRDDIGWRQFAFQQGLLVTGARDKRCCSGENNISVSLRQRESSCCGSRHRTTFTNGICTGISSRFIPNHVENSLNFSEKVFCGSYSEDGSTFLSACQDRNLRVYETQNGLKEPFKVVKAKDVGWSVIDTAFQRDSRFVAYSSWSNYIHLCSVFDRGDPNLSQHHALDLKPDHHQFAVFSLKFSSDGNEIICGANDGYIYVYDMELSNRTTKIDAHEDDINAVCFADSTSQILYSGGDDGLVKVWDRRTFSETNSRPAGVFAGHQDGITYIDTKGDARYLISNSKDQSIKLWDLRRFSESSAVEDVRKIVSRQSWDYRWQNAPKKLLNESVKGDTSVQSYFGHKVLNTLIRARFSPPHSTGSKYVYCGCSSGRVFVYDILTGEVLSKEKKHTRCVRDVDWHPFTQQMISSSWDGTVAVWGWRSPTLKTKS